jgi:hypothetical protein
MASVSVTNQTLTMTIDIDGIETVIRKDNCKVQAFGTMVRITDYKGSIYEFLYSDCTSPSQPNANALRDAIEAFLNTGGGGGGGGITTITSIDGSIDIDLSNSSAPDLSIGAILSYFTATNLSENSNGTITVISNRIGGTITLVNVNPFEYTLTRTGGSALTGTVTAYLSQLVNDAGSSLVSVIGNGITFGDSFTLVNYDGAALDSASIVKDALLTIIYVP